MQVIIQILRALTGNTCTMYCTMLVYIPVRHIYKHSRRPILVQEQRYNESMLKVKVIYIGRIFENFGKVSACSLSKPEGQAQIPNLRAHLGCP